MNWRFWRKKRAFLDLPSDFETLEREARKNTAVPVNNLRPKNALAHFFWMPCDCHSIFGLGKGNSITGRISDRIAGADMAGACLGLFGGTVTFFPVAVNASIEAGIYSALVSIILGFSVGRYAVLRSARKSHFPVDNVKERFRTLPICISQYLQAIIQREEREIIGEDKPLVKLETRASELLGRARTLRERLLARQKQYKKKERPEYLDEAISRADKLITDMERTKDGLDTHLAKLRAFFAECRSRVDQIIKPLSDLELTHELEQLGAEADDLRFQVGDALMISTRQLAGRLHGIREQMDLALERAGVKIAVESLGTGAESTVERDFEVLRDTVSRFLPKARESMDFRGDLSMEEPE